MRFESTQHERWSLRSQFIAPLGATIVLVSGIITAVSWFAASSASERDTLQKLDNVYRRCVEANYPMTSSVLKQIRMFSGVDIALLDSDKSIKTCTLDVSDKQSFAPILDVASGKLSAAHLPNRVYDATWHELKQTPLSKDFSFIVLMLDQAERKTATQRALWPPAITGIISVLAMALVATMIAARIANRIERMESQVNRIADGAYDVVDIPGPEDALARLSRSVNKMSNQLALAHDRIAKSERSRLINLVASGMAHQLRNSLTGAVLCLQSYIRAHPQFESEELSMAFIQLKLAQESIRRLLASNSESEMADYADLSIGGIHDTLNSYVKKYAEHHQVDFVLEDEKVNPQCMIHQGSAIVGALLNLVMNAIEATGSGGHVRCRLSMTLDNVSRDEVWLWRIEDDGPGPNEQILQSMMEPFVTSKPEGVGLGLPMAKRVAEKFNGSLRWHREENKTVFEFCIKKEPSG